MAWHTQTHSTSMDSLLLSSPTRIQQFFEHPDFINQLRSLNPKLSYYLRDSVHLLQQALTFVTVPPSESDSALRKHKYPLLAAQLIQAQNPSIVGCFFPQLQATTPLLDLLFQPILSQRSEILPLLASYLQRIIKCLYKVKPVQMLQYVYSNPETLRGLLSHSYNKSIELTLQALLNVENSKDRPSENRLRIRLETALMIINRFKEDPKGQRGSNLGEYLIDLVQRYHLIADGKRMLDLLLTEESVQWCFHNVGSQSVLRLLKSITNYYCMSMLNSQQPQNLSNPRSLLMLQEEPFIRILSLWIPRMLQTQFSYKYHRTVQIVCHSMCIRSPQILRSLVECNFFQAVFSLFFRTDSSIFHNLIQKTVTHIFSSQRPIYQLYKQHLFYDVDIIRQTAGRIEHMKFDELVSKSYAGHLVSIIKLYSRIQTNSQRIKRMIEKNQECWIKVVTGVVKMYQEITRKQMGTYDIEDKERVTEYRVVKVFRSEENGTAGTHMASCEPKDAMVQEQNQEELSLLMATAKLSRSIEEAPDSQPESSKENTTTFNQQHPEVNKTQPILSFKHPQQTIINPFFPEAQSRKQLSMEIPPATQQVHSPPPSSFDQYMKRASKRAQQTIKLRRSSVERQLTPVSKGLSPAKLKQSWTDLSAEKVPLKGAAHPVNRYLNSIKVKIAASPPKQIESKRFRSMEAKDIPLLSFLGIIKGGR